MTPKNKKVVKITISGFEGLYEAHSNGKIWSFFRNKYLSFSPKKNYYHRPTLIKNGVKYQISAHRIIASLFVPNPDKKTNVNHKNGIKYDNRPENLEWCTPSENAIHAFKTGLRYVKSGKASNRYGKFGKDAHASKPIQKIHAKTGKILKSYDSVTIAANDCKIVRSAISNCLSGLSNTAGGFKWKKTKK